MLNSQEHRPNPPSDSPSRQNNTGVAGVESTIRLLREKIPFCAACDRPLDGHDHRFFSCHPVAAGDEFLAAAQSGDWAAVHAMQTPSVHQASFKAYAIACPASSHAAGQAGGMVALLRLDSDGDAALELQQAFPADAFAALRVLCPTCQWITFAPAPAPQQEAV